MDYCWGGCVISYSLTQEGKATFQKHMWAFIENVANYDLDTINSLLENFKELLKEFDA